MKYLYVFALISTFAGLCRSDLTWRPVELDDQRMLSTIYGFQRDMSAKIDPMFYYKITEIIKAESRRISREYLRVEFNFARTSCFPSQQEYSSIPCEPVAHPRKCLATIEYNLWTGFGSLTEFGCEH